MQPQKFLKSVPTVEASAANRHDCKMWLLGSYQTVIPDHCLSHCEADDDVDGPIQYSVGGRDRRGLACGEVTRNRRDSISWLNHYRLAGKA